MQKCKKDWLGTLLVSALSALTLTMLADIVYVWLAAEQMWQEQSLTLVKFAAIFVALLTFDRAMSYVYVPITLLPE